MGNLKRVELFDEPGSRLFFWENTEEKQNFLDEGKFLYNFGGMYALRGNSVCIMTSSHSIFANLFLIDIETRSAALNEIKKF